MKNISKYLILSLAVVSLAACNSSPSSKTPFEGEATKLAYSLDDYSDNGAYNTPNCPTTGSPKILVIPVWFTDSGNYLTSADAKSNVKTDIERCFFGNDTGWHSVASYYKEESNGRLNLTGTVTDWYECGYPSSHAAASVGIINTIVQNASDWFFENNPGEKKTDYDLDKNGYIDAISLIYAAPDYATADQDVNNLWAFCYWIQTTTANVAQPAPNTYFWSSYDFMYSEATSYNRAGTAYGGGSTNGLTVANPVDTHTAIHEFGHVLGLDFDYYDYSYQYTPAGGFSMQDLNVGGHDPFSVMAYGWADPYIPTQSCTIEIGAFQTTREVVLLTPEWNEYDSPFDEYLLLELYTPTGLNELDCNYSYRGYYPAGPLTTGIRLWHVDARLAPMGIPAGPNNTVTLPVSDDYYVVKAFTNTYWSDDSSVNSGYCTIYGREYADYNYLQLIRNTASATYRPKDYLSRNHLFMDGDTFSMEQFSKQFVNGTQLNGGSELGWSFSVTINGTGANATASIELTKA